jgi:hypothetical protein
MTRTAFQWFTSSCSDDEGGARLEVARTEHTVHIDDSKASYGPTFHVGPETRTAFPATTK